VWDEGAVPRDGEQRGGHRGAGGSLESRRRLLGKEESFAQARLSLKKWQLRVKEIQGSPGDPLWR